MPFRAQRTAHNSPRRPVPIHRGPQAVSHPASGSQPIHHAPNAALLIDFDNVTMGIRSDLQTELKNLLASDIIKGKVSVQRAYADWRRYPQYIVPLAESSIDMIMAPAYGSAKKNATDIRLAIDALELVFVRPEIGTFILLSGDSDFSSLVIKLKEYGKYVIGVGIRESSSDLLVMNCDEYYSYNSLAGLVKSGDEEVVKHDPWELVTEAIQKMKRNGDVMRADRLKQVMQQMDPTFDEKNVGKSKFSLFVTEAAKKGLVALTKLENGQFEVDLPKEGAEVALPEPEAAAPKAPETEDGRRPRRESRGRGRGRGDRSPRTERPTAGAAAAPAPLPATTEKPVEPTPRETSSGEIGSSGLRLTRAEAFDLVKRATASLASGDSAAAASLVRSTARALLGRDSESLSERNFTRILQDAHDADVIDLRRRGSDYEVAVAAGAPTVSAQLAAAQPVAPSAKPAAPAPRGMAARGGRGPMGRPGAPPPHILSVGVVGTKKTAPQPEQEIPVPAIDSPSPSAVAEEKVAAKTGKGRKRGGVGRKTSARKKTTASETPAAAPAAQAPKPPARKRAPRGGRKNAKSGGATAAVGSGGAGSEPE